MTMSTGSLYIVLIVAVVGLAALIYAVLAVRRSRTPAASSLPSAERPPRSALWALLLITTVPLAVYATAMGGFIMAVILDRCYLWACNSNPTLADLDLSPGTLGQCAFIAALSFGVWWLALLPSPLPRNPRLRRALQLGIATLATLLIAVEAFFGIL